MTISAPVASDAHDRPSAAVTRVVWSIVRVLGGAFATALVASFGIFVALAFTPGDPVSRVVGQRATDEQRASARHALGLDQPIPVRFVHWLGNALHGDFGRSITYRQEVSSLLAPRISTTLFLVVMAAVIIVVFGVALGAFGGWNRSWRPAVSTAVGLGISIPSFVAASVLTGTFAVELGWFPTFGAGQGFWDRIHHLTLPAIALSLAWTAYVAQITMAAVREEADKEHVTTATGRGLKRSIVFRRHVLRNAALPVLTASGLTVAGLVAGSVVVETAFGVDGIGSLLVKSVPDKDYPVVMAISTLIVMIFVAVTALLDVVQVLLDPRLRTMGRTK